MQTSYNKNVHEIRLEVLLMAIGLAESAYHNELSRRQVAAGETGSYELPEDKRVRESLRNAKKLYTFIEGDQTDDSE